MFTLDKVIASLVSALSLALHAYVLCGLNRHQTLFARASTGIFKLDLINLKVAIFQHLSAPVFVIGDGNLTTRNGGAGLLRAATRRS